MFVPISCVTNTCLGIICERKSRDFVEHCNLIPGYTMRSSTLSFLGTFFLYHRLKLSCVKAGRVNSIFYSKFLGTYIVNKVFSKKMDSPLLYLI
jgi:hypothetical protein